jgi:phage terminase large subunit-like protein
MNSYREAEDYANAVINGKIITGKLVKLACQRFIDDINNPMYEYRVEEVKKCLKFLNCLKHYTGAHNGKPFELLPFQVFITANLVGLYNTGSNRRKYTQAYIQLSRKNGKSFWAAALSLYFFLLDGEAAAEVLVLANSREQAKTIDFAIISALAQQLDAKQKTMQIFRDYLSIPKLKCRLKVIAAEARTGDGYNASVGLIDEFHEAPDNKMIDLVVSSQGMRERPLCLVITTAGFDLGKPCYNMRNYCVDVLNGIQDDPTQFAAIYELDDDDDWQDSKNWIKSNPALGQTVKLAYLKEQVKKATNNPINEVGVKTKNLNIWCQSSDVWIQNQRIVESMKELDFKQFNDCVAYVGVDLAAVSDLTAVNWLIQQDGKFYNITKYYLPEAALIDKTNKETYKLWRRTGQLTITPGNVTDYDYVLRDIMESTKYLMIAGVYYDSWNATQFAINATEAGLPMQPYSQAIGNFNRPTKEFERLMLQGHVILNKSEVTSFCFRNVIIKQDINGNAKPVKYDDNNKIDGVIAILTALGGYLEQNKYSNEII